MSALSIGLSTFNSCNKVGSIPHFTQHLTRYPNDYRALTWRGRAYSIIGKTAEAKADFQKACRVSSGSQNLLARALLKSIDGNMKQKHAILQNTTRQYPNCSEAWSELGEHTYHVDGEVDLSLQHLGRADRLATINSETGEPWYPWCSQTIGDIYFIEKQRVSEARKHYSKAVESSNTLTIGHLGLSRCDILRNNLASAKSSYLTAKGLNPVLVKWETFDDFRRQVLAQQSIASLASEFSKIFTDLFTQTPQREAEELHHQQIKEEDQPIFQIGARSRDTRAQGSRSVSEQGYSYNDGPNKLEEVEPKVVPIFHGKSFLSSAGARFRDTRAQSSRSFSGSEYSYYDQPQLREVEPNVVPSYQRHQYSAGTRSQDKKVQGSKSLTQKPLTHSRRSVSASQGGIGSGGKGNGGSSDGSGSDGSGSDGSGSDGEEDTPEQRAQRKWKKKIKKAPSAKRYRGKYFYQSENKENWYSKIKPSERHGGAYFKKYVDKGRTIELVASLDENMKEMTAKHESGKYAVIKKSDMQGIY